ncbi:MAG: cytochrome b [Planctomycetota bacterium]
MIKIIDALRQNSFLDDLIYLLKKKEVPIHKYTIWYYLGGMALFLFITQFVTGILLLFYYKPSAEEAFESVQHIMSEVSFGWLIRSIHSWSANLLIFVIFVHLFSVFFLKAYRKPRELTWTSGCFLLFIALGFGFTGYLLPWNKLALFATKVGSEIAGSVPLIGKWILRFLRGGEEVTGATLNRFFAIHVWVLPVLFFVFIAIHLFLVQKHGMSIPLSIENTSYKMMKFFPNFLLRDMVGWLSAIGIFAALSAFFPPHLGEKADPFAPAPAGIKPEWYFLFMFQTLKILPAKIGPLEGEVVGIALFSIAGILLIFIPFLDKQAIRGKKNPIFTLIGIFAIVYMVIMTVWGYLS